VGSCLYVAKLFFFVVSVTCGTPYRAPLRNYGLHLTRKYQNRPKVAKYKHSRAFFQSIEWRS